MRNICPFVRDEKIADQGWNAFDSQGGYNGHRMSRLEYAASLRHPAACADDTPVSSPRNSLPVCSRR
jgi:hypothetical protein